MCILDEIYQELYLSKMPDTKEYQAVRDHVFDVWESLEKELGLSYADKVWEAVAALNLEESRHDFKEGFRLGVQLMREAHSLPGATKAIR